MLYDGLFTFFAYSMMGWLLEVMYAYYREKRFVNRGFLYGPMCPIYGTGTVLMLWIFDFLRANEIFNFYESMIGVFFFGFFFASLMELIVGMVLEKMFKTRWWDYSDRKFNIKGYIALQFSALWGVGSLVILFLINPVIEGIWLTHRQMLSNVVFVLSIYLIVDFAFTVKAMVDYRVVIDRMQRISRDLSGRILANIEEIERRGLLIRKDWKDRVEELKQDMEEQKEDFHEAFYRRYMDVLQRVKEEDHPQIRHMKQTFEEWVDARMEGEGAVRNRYQAAKEKLSKAHLLKAYPKSKSRQIGQTLKSIKETIEEKKENNH
ncbi:MAG TPA: hypothetical protein DHN33_02575 [Eubacteriaceae bacterium]|nr:hypothetical protein [Eubacteriaceae bacterium]